MINRIYPQISLRWITISCFEIRIGNHTIVTDPTIGLSPNCEEEASVIQGADLITVSHIHWDHIADVKELAEKFHSKILVGDLSAMDFIRYLNCNQADLYPMSHQTTLDFGWVKVTALMGRHSDMKESFLQTASRFERNPLYAAYPELSSLMAYGSLEYRNYLFETPDRFRILFYGNLPAEEQLHLLKDIRPDILLMQFTRPIPKEISQFAAQLSAKVLIPHHMDLKKRLLEYKPQAEELCQIFEAERPGSIGITPVPKQWYDFSESINCRNSLQSDL